MYASYERRSQASPMDVDPPRKRPHQDLSDASPFVTRSHHRPAHALFSPSAARPSSSSSPSPFLFHNPPPLSQQHHARQPSAPFSWDPSSFNPVTAFGLADVEMADASFTAPDPPVIPLPTSSSTHPDGLASHETERKLPQPRKVAIGAVQREMKKRSKGAATLRRKGSTGSLRRSSRSRGGGEGVQSDDQDSAPGDGRTDDDESDASVAPQSSSRRRRASSSRALERKSSSSRPTTSHFNLHLPGRSVSHGEIPYILLGYLQFFFNLSLVLILLYLAVQFIRTVQHDINRKVEEVSFETLQEITICTNLYLTNQCDPDRRVPAMQQACSGWEHCMNRDPTVVGRARVGAETFAGVVNSFVEPISWKAMGFTLVTLTFATIVLNSALSFYRASHRPEPHSSSHRSSPPWQQPDHYGRIGPGGGGYDGRWEQQRPSDDWRREDQTKAIGSGEKTKKGWLS